MEGSCKARSVFVRFRRLSPGAWLYKAQTCALGSLLCQTLTEGGEKTGELRPCTASRKGDRSEVGYLVTQGVKGVKY